MKIKGPNIKQSPLTRKPEQQRFKIRIGVLNLTGISSRQHNAISGPPFQNERTLDPQSATRQTRLHHSQPHCGLHPAVFPSNYSVF